MKRKPCETNAIACYTCPQQHLESADAIELDIDSILPDPANRAGAPLNIPFMHGLHKRFKEDGFDPNLFKTPYVVRYKSHDKIEKLIKHSQRLSSGTSGMMPPIVEDLACSGSIGSSHGICTLRLNRHNVKSSLTGEVMSVDPSDEPWKAATTKKMKCYVFRDTLTDDQKVVISAYLNSEQDTSQTSSEISIMKLCQRALQAIMKQTDSRMVLPLVRFGLIAVNY